MLGVLRDARSNTPLVLLHVYTVYAAVVAAPVIVLAPHLAPKTPSAVKVSVHFCWPLGVDAYRMCSL